MERKLAPFYPPIDEDNAPTDLGPVEECPLCFLSFVGGMNATLCCNQRMCSECYIQVQEPPGVPGLKDCPFCMRSSFMAVFRVLTDAEIKAEKEEAHKVIQLTERKRMSDTMRALSKTLPIAASDIFTSDSPGKGKTEEREEMPRIDPDEEPDSTELLARAVELSLQDGYGEVEVEEPLVVDEEADFQLALQMSLQQDW